MFIVIETSGGPKYAAIVTDTDGTNKVFSEQDDAETEASECQDGLVIEIC